MRLRDWAGTAATITSAVLERWLGETLTVAALTAAVVVFGGILWRRVSILMAAPQPGNCTKAYAVEARLVNYMGLMAPLAPIVTANTPVNTNATFLAGLTATSNTSTDGLANGTINGTSGGASAGTAHTHGPGSFAVADGLHNHQVG